MLSCWFVAKNIQYILHAIDIHLYPLTHSSSNKPGIEIESKFQASSAGFNSNANLLSPGYQSHIATATVCHCLETSQYHRRHHQKVMLVGCCSDVLTPTWYILSGVAFHQQQISCVDPLLDLRIACLEPFSLCLMVRVYYHLFNCGDMQGQLF